jgi:hypothetical protein
MSGLYLSCSHEDSVHTTGWLVHLKDFDREGNRVVRYKDFCSECFSWWLATAPQELISDTPQKEEWLNG